MERHSSGYHYLSPEDAELYDALEDCEEMAEIAVRELIRDSALASYNAHLRSYR